MAAHALDDTDHMRIALRMGMQSVRRTIPVPVSNSVSRTRVSLRYRAARRSPRHGRQLPETVIVVTEQPGEARTGVEPGQAQPVDGSIATDQSRRVGVADQAVILDGECHGLILTRRSPANVRHAPTGGPSAQSEMQPPVPIDLEDGPTRFTSAFAAAMASA